METPNESAPKESPTVHREIYQRTVDLATAAFGLVAALAWNDAVRSLFERVFGTAGGGVAAKFGYAALVTAVVLFVTIRLQRAASRK